MKYQADYRKAVQAAEETLEGYGDTLIPLRLELLMDHLSNEIRLITYSEFMLMQALSIDEVIRMLDSDLGACVYKPKSGQYLIFYNDQMPTDVCRFTIGHELGHIILMHHELAQCDVLSRTYVPRQQYQEFEKEANAFARNLLSPACLANLVNKRSHGTAVQDISRVFYISPKAAKVRIDYIKQDLSCLSTEMLAFFAQFHAVRKTQVCRGCQTALGHDMAYCPLCGTDKQQWGYAYHELPVDKAEKADSCPCCGCLSLIEGAGYCHICGTPLANICDHGHENPAFAQFCIYCGSRTRNQLLKAVQCGGVNTMDYGPQIPYDTETFRVKSCPKCLYKNHLKDAAFCIMCGTALFNRCDGVEQGNEHANPPNARYCYLCGRPTAYARFLPAFTDMIAMQQELFSQELAESDISPELHRLILGIDDGTEPEQTESQLDENDLPF